MESRDLERGNNSKDIIQNTVNRLVELVAKNEGNHSLEFRPSIFTVPGILRDVSPSCFDPRVVSIGPLHRDHKNVKALEARKPSYMIKLMGRISSPREEILKSCAEKVYASMDRIKACYVWNKTYNDAEIAEMMVLDACFILEFCFQYRNEILDIETFRAVSVMRDLVSLENQIPFFVLNEIFHCTTRKFRPNLSLINYILPVVFKSLFGKRMPVHTNNISIETTHHLLSLLHQTYKPQKKITPESPSSYVTIPSVVHLERAGVTFKPYDQKPTWDMEMEVKFFYRFPCFFGSWGKPTLTMPKLVVHDGTEFLLRNYIVYEQLFETGTYFTSYAAIMDNLVSTPEDVSELVDLGVIDNMMGSNKEAAYMINSLCKNVQIAGNLYYTEKCQILKDYCNLKWPKHIANIRRTYFNSPWNMIGLFAGVLLFILATLQTIFTIKSAT